MREKAMLGQVCQFVNSGNEEKEEFEDTKRRSRDGVAEDQKMMCVVRKMTKGLNWNVRQQPAESCKQGWRKDENELFWEEWEVWRTQKEDRKRMDGKAGRSSMKFGLWQTSGQRQRRRRYVAQHCHAEWKRRRARSWRTF